MMPQAKVEAAIAYLTGKAARIAHPAKGDPSVPGDGECTHGEAEKKGPAQHAPYIEHRSSDAH